MNIINSKLVVKDLKIDSKDKLFNKIADLLHKENLVTSKDGVVKDLQAREKIGSTAFENGLIIPHARSKHVVKTTLTIVEFKDSDFESIDGKKSNFAVSIIVPEKETEEHLRILSKISGLFSTADRLSAFKKLSTANKVKKLNEIASAKEEKEEKEEKGVKYDFVAVTSCAAGIAHTYMARDGIMDAAKAMGLRAKVETRGSSTENVLTPQEIDDAKFVIIAADVNISKARFYGKKVLEASTNDAIRDGKSLIKEAENQPVMYGKGDKVGKLRIGTTSKKNKLGKSIMGALSFMIPIAIVGGILMSIPNALTAGGNSSGGTWHYPNKFTEALWQFGHIGLLLMVPILAMFLAYKIGGKAAMPAALIGGYFINDGALMGKFSLFDMPKAIGGNASAGFLGGLLVGIIAGYIVHYMKWIKWHKSVKPVSNLMLVPLVSSFLVFLIVVYVIGSPMTWLMTQLYNGLSSISSHGLGVNILIGMLFAGLMAIDLGGPINKTALVVATVIFTDTLTSGNPNFVPQTAVQAAISVPPLGMWLATVLFRKKFSNTEIAAGTAALPMGLVGITEGALPFAFKTPLKAIAANLAGAITAGALVTIFQINFYGGLGSPLGAYVGYATHNFYGLTWIASILIGAIVTGVIFGLITTGTPELTAAHKLRVAEKKQFYKTKGVNTKFDVVKYNTTNFFRKLPDKAKYGMNPKNWIEKPEYADHEEL